MRVALVGTFYPQPTRLGSATTGLADLLSRHPDVSHVTVFGQRGARLHPRIDPARVSVLETWTTEDVGSIGCLGKEILRRSHSIDHVLFNSYLTGFGRSNLANGAGILLPALLRLSGRTAISVYLHNFVEAQNLSNLGYAGHTFGEASARALERLLMLTTDLIAPLESQSKAVGECGGGTVRNVFVPYLEALPDGRMHIGASQQPDNELPIRILLFGAWGPQKDLSTVLECIRMLLDSGRRLSVTIAGAQNPQFQSDPQLLEAIRFGRSHPVVSVVADVPFESVPELFEGTDILLMPYRATGGYSGVMNVASFFGVPVIASDLEGLRETALLSGAQVEYVQMSNMSELHGAIESAIDNLAKIRKQRMSHQVSLDRSVHQAARLVGLG